MKASCARLIMWVVLGGLLPTPLLAEEYMSQDAFLVEAFTASAPEASRLWLSKDQKAEIKKLLGHEYNGLRVRYWKRDQRTAWILEEVGKEQPITIGVSVVAGRIERVHVLAFRESRGWEVRHGFFTDQFKNAALLPSRELDRTIDGITGATLSVRAVKKVARLALYLDSLVNPS